MSHHAVSPLLATGSADHSVRVWDSEKAYCTHHLKGVHGAVLTAVLFHPDPAVMQLFSASEDGSVAVWDLHESRVVRSLKGAHFSTVTSLAVSRDGRLLLSVGRDKIVNLWRLGQNTSAPARTIAALESLESAAFISSTLFYTAGEAGEVKLWDAESGRCVGTSAKLASNGHHITQAKFLADSAEIAVVTSDLLVYILRAADLSTARLLVGHHGEITDAALGGAGDALLAISTNGPEIRVYDRTLDNMQCSLLAGHTEAVISMASSTDYLVAGSRDHTATVWKLVDRAYQKTSTLLGHTDVVSAVAVSQRKTAAAAAATGSADMTLKAWSIDGHGRASARWTVKAHEKDINSIVITPNDKYILSASQDKTAKIWRMDDGQLVGTLKGHKRGVWSVAVSPVAQLAATASADRTIKLWSLSDHACTRTLEGHANSVLKVLFIRQGQQLLSAGSDGLVKVWDVQRGECISTLDAHPDRIWSMIVGDEGRLLFTGDASGTLKVWRDVTDEQVAASLAKRDETIIKEQQLANMVLRKDFCNAVLLAMQLEQPQRMYALIGQIVDGRECREAVGVVSSMLATFSREHLVLLLSYVRDWNTSLKRAYVAQLVLHALLKLGIGIGNGNGNGSRDVLAQIQPYTERHFDKIDELLTGSYLIDFVVRKIK